MNCPKCGHRQRTYEPKMDEFWNLCTIKHVDCDLIEKCPLDGDD